MKKKKQKLEGARKLRKDEEMAWAPPRNKSDWPDCEEARSTEKSAWRLEPEEIRYRVGCGRKYLRGP